MDHCPQCKTEWPTLHLTDEEWCVLASLKRDKFDYRHLLWLRDHKSDVPGWILKSVAGHLALNHQFCHECKTKLEGRGLVICPGCTALNYVFC